MKTFRKIEDLKDYNNNAEEEEINGVLIQANDLLEYRDKIIDTFKDGTFSSKYLKKSDAAAYDYVLKDVDSFIQKIESMSEKLNLSLFEDFFELLPVHYSEMLINIKNADKNKGIVAGAKEKISD